MATAASSSQTHNRLPLCLVPLLPETTAFVSRPQLQLPAAQSLSSAMLLMILLTTLSFVSNLRDTAGQERFRTITTAYYRGAMVSVFQGFMEVKHAYSFVKFIGFKLESSTLEKIDFLMRKQGIQRVFYTAFSSCVLNHCSS